MRNISDTFEIAVRHHQAGRLQAAEQMYRQVLLTEPNHVDASHLLGLIAYQMGKHEIAIEYIRRALSLRPDCVAAHNNLGNVFKDQGKLGEAIACYRKAAQLAPESAEAHFNLGGAFMQANLPNEAIACYRRALQLDPESAEAYVNLGIALREQGKLDETIESYHHAIRIRPEFVEAHNNLGNALRDRGNLDEAVASYRRALELDPRSADIHNNLGIALMDQKKLDESITSYRLALGLNPNFAQAHFNLGRALIDQQRFDEAVASCRRALELDPNYVEAHSNLGVALLELRQLDEAVACFRRALELKPDKAEAHNNLGVALRELGRLNEAVASCRRAIDLKPEYAEAHNNLGATLRELGRLDDAVDCYRRALDLKPNHDISNENLGFALLQTGHWSEGWMRYECRRRINRSSIRRFVQPEWQGESLAGKTILLHTEQGLGDTLQFVRYAAVLKQLGARIVLECQGPLLALLSHCLPIDQIVSAGESLPEFDVQIPLLSVPAVLQTSISSIPADVPYVFADAELQRQWRDRLSGLNGQKIGIAWQGYPGYRMDRKRSITLIEFAPLSQLPGVQLVSLQKGPGREQLFSFSQKFRILDISESLLDFTNTAAVMTNLDLIITCDTAVGHLAGALGVPVWVALSLVPDWRWLLDRDDTPWYPTMRLFRQTSLGDWAGVFARIRQALVQRIEMAVERNKATTDVSRPTIMGAGANRDECTSL